MGVLCVFIGALMLVEPHQFGSPQYSGDPAPPAAVGHGVPARRRRPALVGALMPRTGREHRRPRARRGACCCCWAAALVAVRGLDRCRDLLAVRARDARRGDAAARRAAGAWRRGDLLALVAGTASAGDRPAHAAGARPVRVVGLRLHSLLPGAGMALPSSLTSIGLIAVEIRSHPGQRRQARDLCAFGA